MTVAFTGYRPEKMPFIESKSDENYMRFRKRQLQVIERLIERGCTDFISGVAMGFDIWAAEDVLSLQKKNKALTPFHIVGITQRIDDRARHRIHVSRQSVSKSLGNFDPSRKVCLSFIRVQELLPIGRIFGDFYDIRYRQRMPEKPCGATEVELFINVFKIGGIHLAGINAPIRHRIHTTMLLREIISHEFHLLLVALGIDLIDFDFHPITIPSSSPPMMSSSFSLAQSGIQSSRMAPTTSDRVI